MKTALIAIAAVLLTYLAFSFVVWDANPANWYVNMRALCAWASFSAACISAVGYRAARRPG